MATFDKCTSINNTVGFYTDSLFSEFSNCSVEGGSFGFVDATGEPVAALLKMFPTLQQCANNTMKPGPRREETVQVLTVIEKEIRSKTPEKGVLKKSFNRLTELAKEQGGEAIAQTILLFAKKAPEIFDLLHKAGVLS